MCFYSGMSTCSNKWPLYIFIYFFPSWLHVNQTRFISFIQSWCASVRTSSHPHILQLSGHGICSFEWTLVRLKQSRKQCFCSGMSTCSSERPLSIFFSAWLHVNQSRLVHLIHPVMVRLRPRILTYSSFWPRHLHFWMNLCAPPAVLETVPPHQDEYLLEPAASVYFSSIRTTCYQTRLV